MAADTGATGKIGALLDAIRAGKIKAREDAERVSTLERKALPSALARLRDAGLITFDKPNPRAIDYASIRATNATATPKPARAKRAPVEEPDDEVEVEEQDEPEEPAPRPTRAKAKAAAGDDLEEAIAVTFTRQEVVRLEVLAHTLTTLVETLKASPQLGRDGATLMRLLAKVHGG